MCVLKRQEGVVVGEKVVPIRSKAYPPNTQLENWKLPPPSHSVFVLVHNHYGHARSHDHLVMSWPNALLAWFQTPTTLCVCVYARVHSCLKSVRTHKEARGHYQILFLMYCCRCYICEMWSLTGLELTSRLRCLIREIQGSTYSWLWSSGIMELKFLLFFFIKDFILD